VVAAMSTQPGPSNPVVRRFRNRIVGCSSCGEPNDRLEDHAEGDFVLFEDYQRLLADMPVYEDLRITISSQLDMIERLRAALEEEKATSARFRRTLLAAGLMRDPEAAPDCRDESGATLMGKYGEDYAEECRERKEPLAEDQNLACEKFVRESASDFCAVCGYRNIDHLRKRRTSENGDPKHG
jgi:hypothetical protein